MNLVEIVLRSNNEFEKFPDENEIEVPRCNKEQEREEDFSIANLSQWDDTPQSTISTPDVNGWTT